MKTSARKSIGIWTLLLFCALPASSQASREHPVVGLSIDSFDTPRWQKDRDVFVRTVEKLGGIVVVRSAQASDATQIADIEKFIRMRVDAIVVVAHSGTALGAVMKEANQEHIPVICYDRLIRDADVTCYVGFDNEQVGELQAKYVIDRLQHQGKARIVRISGSQSDPNAALYKIGQDKVLDPFVKSGRIEILRDDWARDWEPAAARAIMTDAIAKGAIDLDAVIAANDNLAGAVIDVLNAPGSKRLPMVTGQDADRAACVRIKDGTQAMTVYKPLDKLAALAGKVAVDVAKGVALETTKTSNNGFKDVPTFLGTVITVDKENLAATVVADGFLR